MCVCAFMVFKQHCSFYLGTCAHVCHICRALEARRGYQVPWNWSYRNCELPDRGSGNRTQVLRKKGKSLTPSSLCSPHYTGVCMLCALCAYGVREQLPEVSSSFYHLGSGAQTRASRLGSKCLCSLSQTFILEQDAKNIEIGASKMTQWLDTC